MPKTTYIERLIRSIDDLEDKDRQQLVDHVLGLSLSVSEQRRKAIKIGFVPDLYDEIKTARANWNQITGLRVDNWVIDRMTMGLAPGELTIIGGATSNGKTALAMNMAANIAKQGKIILFITLEMTKRELGVRFNIIMGDQDFDTYMANLAWQEEDEMDWRSIDALIEAARRDCNADIVFIDHLHYFSRDSDNTAEDLGRVTKEIKKNAIRHNIPVVLISHTRKTMDKKSSKTDLNDLRGSSYIAQDADIVLMVHQEKDRNNCIFVTLNKNRNRYGCRIGSSYEMEFRNLRIWEPARNDKFGK